jgi:hypothetical protein
MIKNEHEHEPYDGHVHEHGHGHGHGRWHGHITVERTMFDIDRGLFRFRVNSISIIIGVELLSDSIKEYDATRTRLLYIATLAAHWPRTGAAVPASCPAPPPCPPTLTGCHLGRRYAKKISIICDGKTTCCHHRAIPKRQSFGYSGQRYPDPQHNILWNPCINILWRRHVVCPHKIVLIFYGSTSLKRTAAKLR